MILDGIGTELFSFYDSIRSSLHEGGGMRYYFIGERYQESGYITVLRYLCVILIPVSLYNMYLYLNKPKIVLVRKDSNEPLMEIDVELDTYKTFRSILDRFANEYKVSVDKNLMFKYSEQYPDSNNPKLELIYEGTFVSDENLQWASEQLRGIDKQVSLNGDNILMDFLLKIKGFFLPNRYNKGIKFFPTTEQNELDKLPEADEEVDSDNENNERLRSISSTVSRKSSRRNSLKRSKRKDKSKLKLELKSRRIIKQTMKIIRDNMNLSESMNNDNEKLQITRNTQDMIANMQSTIESENDQEENGNVKYIEIEDTARNIGSQYYPDRNQSEQSELTNPDELFVNDIGVEDKDERIRSNRKIESNNNENDQDKENQEREEYEEREDNAPDVMSNDDAPDAMNNDNDTDNKGNDISSEDESKKDESLIPTERSNLRNVDNTLNDTDTMMSNPKNNVHQSKDKNDNPGRKDNSYCDSMDEDTEMMSASPPFMANVSQDESFSEINSGISEDDRSPNAKKRRHSVSLNSKHIQNKFFNKRIEKELGKMKNNNSNDKSKDEFYRNKSKEFNDLSQVMLTDIRNDININDQQSDNDSVESNLSNLSATSLKVNQFEENQDRESNVADNKKILNEMLISRLNMNANESSNDGDMSSSQEDVNFSEVGDEPLQLDTN